MVFGSSRVSYTHTHPEEEYLAIDNLNGSAMPPTLATTRSRNFSRCSQSFCEVFANNAPKRFGNDRFCRCDQFRTKVIEIGAILAIFEPFEVSKIHVPRFLRIWPIVPGFTRNPIRIELSPGRLSKFFEKCRVAF